MHNKNNLCYSRIYNATRNFYTRKANKFSKGVNHTTAITPKAKVATKAKLAKSAGAMSESTAHFNSPPTKSEVATANALIDAVKAPE